MTLKGKLVQDIIPLTIDQPDDVDTGIPLNIFLQILDITIGKQLFNDLTCLPIQLLGNSTHSDSYYYFYKNWL